MGRGSWSSLSRRGSIRGMKGMTRSSRTPQRRGGASLLTTVVLSVILLAIVGGLSALSVRELRQASDTDQSQRALNAAESGVQLAAKHVETATATNPIEETTCNARNGGKPLPIDGAAGQDLAVTCETITTQGAVVEAQLGKDASIQYDLRTAKDGSSPATVAKVVLEWGLPSDAGNSLTAYTGAGYPSSPGDSWKTGTPAAVETTSTSWSGSNFSPVETSIIDPTTAHCTAGTTYTCKADMTTGTGELIKLTPRYAAMKYRLTFYDASGKQVFVQWPMAVIDVTARSGQLYRRVKATKMLPGQRNTSTFGYVLFSGQNICKDLKVDKGRNPINGGNAKNSSDCEQ